MIVIGFTWPIEHDHSTAVILDGELVFAVEEERFTRHKHSPKRPSIKLTKTGIQVLKEEGNKA